MIRWLLISLVKGYRLFLSPWLGSACRFEPTCSVYALQALEQYGAVGGGWLTIARLGRCHPWCQGGHDPLPTTAPRTTRLFSRLLSPVPMAAPASLPDSPESPRLPKLPKSPSL